MDSLGKIKSNIKTGQESLIFNKSILQFKLIDFWRWSVSDIVSNATRGRFAEFIVATATNVDLTIPRDEWQSFDLITPEKIKIEVKSAAYIQSWAQKSLSKISFSIKPARLWNNDTGEFNKNPSRCSDVYVMCLLHICNQETINPLDMSHWNFYVLSTEEINNYPRSQHSITLNSLNKLTNPVPYDELYMEIKNKSHKQNMTSI